jgi:N-acetylglucosamine kinase-like BadF-type ATPase
LIKKLKEQNYLLGVDTGSSKTHALISDLSGNIVGFGESGSGNYETVGEENFKEALQLAVKEAVKSAQISRQEITAMGFGFCGYDWPSEEPIMVNAINSLGITCSYQFVNDVTLGLIAGSSAGWGIAVDAGSGNNVRGRDKSGKIGRITGNGMRFGEFGGASEIVWRGMLAATYAWSSRGQKTKISQLLMAYADVESEDALIEGLATGKINFSSDLAKDIIRLAIEGDNEALKAVEFNARELGLNVNAVIRQLNFQNLIFEIVMIGSVFNVGEIYTRPFKETVLEYAPKAKFLHLSVPPVIGAILLAAEIIELKTNEFRNALVHSIARFVL